MSRAARLLLSFLFLLLGAPGIARAQDEIDAALAHARDGRKGDAEAILKKVLDGKPPPHVRAGADLVRAEILRVEADSERDLARFQELMDRSVDHLRSCLRDAPPGSLAIEARRGLDWRLHRKAERAARAFRSETDAQKAALMKRSAEDLYDALERHYKERARGARVGDDEGMEVLLDLARSWLDRAKLVSTDEESRKRILGDAIALLQDFQFDHFDSEMSFEALLLEGQCHALLGDAASAKDRFTGAASLEKRLEESRTAPDAYHRGILRSASFLLTENAFEAGEPRQVLAIVERALARDPELAGPPGHPLRLQKAEALFQLGDLAGAHALATEVTHTESDGPNARSAKEKLRLWSQGAASPGGEMTPERLLLTAEERINSDDWLGALEILRRAVEACPDDDARKRFEPDAFHKMGQCFQKLERYQEASFSFERVFLRHPDNDLAPRACFEAALSLGVEFDRTADPRDDELKEKRLSLLLEKWPDHPATRNVAFLQAKKLEQSKRYGEAAEKYLSVPEDAEAHESALIEAARCRLREAGALEEKSGEGSADRVRSLLAGAEETLGKFFARASQPKHAPRGSQQTKARARWTFEATRELALVHSHPASAKYDEALRVIDAYAAGLNPDDTRMAELLALQVRPLLALEKVDEASRVLDDLFRRFPKSRAVRPAARAAALHLEERADAMIAAKKEPGEISPLLRLIDRCASRWLGEGPDRPRSRDEALRAAEKLHANALRLNGIDDSPLSIADIAEKPIPEPEPLGNVASLNASLADGKFGALKPDDRLACVSRLARARTLIAKKAEDLEQVEEIYARMIKETGLIKSTKQIDGAVIGSRRGLLRLYMDYGRLLLELGRKDQKVKYEKALDVFENLVRASEAGSEPWWISRYMTLAIRMEREGPNDEQYARVMFENLAKNNPEFDSDRFGMRARFVELGKKIQPGGSR